MIWRCFSINNNLIKFSTAKAVLINLPSTCAYRGFVFWHPAKLVKTGNMSVLLYTDDFVFRLKKYGNGRFNQREILDSTDLPADKLVNMFSMIHVCDDDVELIHRPDRIDPVECFAIKDLVDE